MKLRGFTLAEVLVTLGIIGVVAALTLPTLTTNTTRAQIGPKLAKAVSVFEQANEALLNSQSADGISETDFAASANDYAANLTSHMKAVNEANFVTTKDNVRYIFESLDTAAVDPDQPAHNNYIGIVKIDINGEAEPNSAGDDEFWFGLYNDGSLRPKGGSLSWNNSDNQTWREQCAANSTPMNNARTYCAGHVFEHNLRVEYD